jgi:hypothetical protein
MWEHSDYSLYLFLLKHSGMFTLNITITWLETEYHRAESLEYSISPPFIQSNATEHDTWTYQSIQRYEYCSLQQTQQPFGFKVLLIRWVTQEN